MHDIRLEQRELGLDELRGMWAGLLAEGRHTDNVSLYVHNLLCPTKCAYCHCSAREVRAGGERQALVDAICAEAARFADIFEGHRFRNASFGGGTPNVYTLEQMAQLFEGIFSRFSVRDGGQQGIEFNPANTTRDKLALALEHGFNWLSFGVETLTGSVLRAYNRAYQRTAKVQRALEMAHAVGFQSINCDLILLSGETAGSWRETTRTVAALGPQMMSLFRYRAGEYEMPQDDGGVAVGYGLIGEEVLPFEEGYAIWREACEAQGYLVVTEYTPTALSHMAIRPEWTCPWRDDERYTEDPQHNASVFGLGPYARSICRGHATWTNMSYAVPGRPFEPRYQGATHDPLDDARGLLISRLDADQSVERAAFEGLFGGDLEALLGPELRLLKAAGAVDVDDERLDWRLDTPLARKQAALILAGEADARRLEERLAAAGQGVESGGPRPHPPWIPGGPIAGTGWRVLGPWEGGPGWTLLEGPAGEALQVEVRPSDDAPAFQSEGGWSVAYRGSELPQSAVAALRALLSAAKGHDPGEASRWLEGVNGG